MRASPLPETAKRRRGIRASLGRAVLGLLAGLAANLSAADYHAEALDRDMVRVDGGAFPYGMTKEEKQRAAKAAGVHVDLLRDHADRATQTVAGFWLDRYPVTRGQFARFLKATGYTIITNGWVVGWRELTESWPPDQPGQESLPVIGVSAQDAEAYAKWVGKRLPTEVEWELAARGTDGRWYPWGNEFSADACYEGHGGIPFSASFPVGSWPAGASPCGALDMVGLVCQYVRTTWGKESHILVGSSVFHTQAYSRMVTSRLGWASGMRNYVSGFRCAADQPPADGAARAAYTPPPRVLPQPVLMRKDLYLKEPITLRRTETTSLEIRVPWFPASLWVIDLPEATIGPFVGANRWPQPGSQVQWTVTPDGQRAGYVREKGSQRVALDAWVDGNRVRFRFACRQVSLTLYDICMKNLSPFFSSQERLTQGVCRDGKFLRVADMPVGFHPAHRERVRVEDRQPFFWAVDQAVPPGKHGLLRSYDGSAFVARVGVVPCEVWGNSSIPCIHLSPLRDSHEPSGSVIFFIGTLAELEPQLNDAAPPPAAVPAPPAP